MAPVMLSRSAAQTPVHAAYVPVLYELMALRLFAPFWPSDEHYCRFPGNARGSIEVRTTSLENPDLLAHYLAYQYEVGWLAAEWRVGIATHLAGADGATFAIEPAKDKLELGVLAEDLRCLGTNLAASIRQLARARVAMLGPVDTAAAEPARASSRPGAPLPPGLSAREGEVLELFLAGLAGVTIGCRLFISPHTVRNHLKHICAKLGVTSQRELRELFAVARE